MDLKLLPTLNHCIFVFSFTGMLNARSPYAQFCFILAHTYCSIITFKYLRDRGILKAITTGQVFNVVRVLDPGKLSPKLDDFFVSRMFVLTSIGMYTYEIKREGDNREKNHLIATVSFQSPGTTMKVDLLSRLITGGYTVFAGIQLFPFHFEEFLDAIHAIINHNNQPRVVAILLRHLSFCTLNENVISHIISFLPEVSRKAPSLLIETNAKENCEWTSGLRPCKYPIDSYYSPQKFYRPYIPRNTILFTKPYLY